MYVPSTSRGSLAWAAAVYTAHYYCYYRQQYSSMLAIRLGPRVHSFFSAGARDPYHQWNYMYIP